MLHAVAYRYGVAGTPDMDIVAIRFWFRGHERLLAEEREHQPNMRA